MYKIVISSGFLLFVILGHNIIYCREWDSLVQEYFPKIACKESYLGNKYDYSDNILAYPKIVTQTDVNLCLKQSQKLLKRSIELDQQPTGETFQSSAMNLFFTNPMESETEQAWKHSKAILLATKILQNKISSCAFVTPNTFLAFLEAREFIVPKFSHPPICPMTSAFRSYDGKCNNPMRPLWGSANSHFTRIATPNYNDGLYSLPKSKSGNNLPSSRLLSDRMFRNVQKYSSIMTNMAVQWGQFVAHDLSQRTMEQCSTGGVQCCSNDGSAEIYPEHRPSSCAPIIVPYDDAFYSQRKIRCLNFVRSVTAPTIDGSLGPAQQMNTVSNFLDGSPIYSSNITETDRLRSFSKGKLHLTSKKFLPTTTNPNENCDSSITGGQCPCYLGGDARINQTPLLAALQTLLAREHNRISDSLYSINPHWDDEKLFQVSRKILIAEIQHITYQEWLPLCIGKKYVMHHKISPVGLYSFDYDFNINPGIINSFATAAFRFFHTLIPHDIQLQYNDNYNNAERFRLSEHFLNPSLLEYYDNGLEAILRGAISQSAMEAGARCSSEISNYLFKSTNKSGIDLIALDIQRGRDHGLANYNTYRSICGLKKADCFEDLSKEISKDRINLLKSIYEHVDDIDLFVGGSMEKNVHDSILGPTFQCIIGEQFYRTRVGDKYFYDIADTPHSFTSAQLREIKSASMARLICDNSNVKNIQCRAFEQINYNNPLYNCENIDKIPVIDLNYWKEVWPL